MNIAVVEPALAEQTLGSIARELPGAAAVFRRHGLDYCCGGSETLSAAAAAAGLDPQAIEHALAALAPAAS